MALEWDLLRLNYTHTGDVNTTQKYDRPCEDKVPSRGLAV